MLKMRFPNFAIIIEFQLIFIFNLGWYRQCNVISYTTDIDFGADSRFASEELSESLMTNKYKFKFLYIWGIVSKGYEYSLMRSGYKGKFVKQSSFISISIFKGLDHMVQSFFS